MSYLLGIDIGTSGTKTLICGHDGHPIATATAEHDVSSPHPGWSEQDPAQWWEATIAATQAVLKKADVSGDQITAIGLSGQMHGSVFINDDDPESVRALRPALLWNDQRTVDECNDLESAARGREQLIEMTGNPALTGFQAPKILWVRKNEPDVFDQTSHVLLPKDYIRYKMTGEYATEVGDASGTSLLDVKNRAWHTELMSKLELDPALFPECHESHEVTGRLSAWAAQQLGVARDTPVVGGSGDQPAGAVGNGIVREGIVSATMGTSGVVFAHASEPVRDPAGRVHSMCSAVAGEWCVFGCMLSAGGSFQWFRNELGMAEVQKAQSLGVDPYELLVQEAQAAPRGAEGLFFMPYLTGERCPHADPYARGGWVGLTARSNRQHMIRALLEGVTYGMGDALNIIRGMGIDIDSVRLSGGGARSAFWRQLQADIYDARCTTINAEEGPAYGVAILAGVGTGVWSSVPEACDAVISETESRDPDPEARDFYDKAHDVYNHLYPALKDQFEKLNALS